jgi:hypothetical protein
MLRLARRWQHLSAACDHVRNRGDSPETIFHDDNHFRSATQSRRGGIGPLVVSVVELPACASGDPTRLIAAGPSASCRRDLPHESPPGCDVSTHFPG